MSAIDIEESEFEYEYSTTETETFYIDLDLSSVNDVIKSRNAGDRRTLKSFQKPSGNAQRNQSGVAVRGEGAADNQQEQDIVMGDTSPRPPVGEELAKAPAVELDGPGDKVQILELLSTNPIISYRNAIYSCTWTDMIGTNMFFTKHNEVPMHEPELATEDYDMIGTSRIKLVGRKAKVTPKLQEQTGEGASSSSQLRSSRKRTRAEQEAGDEGHDQDPPVGAEQQQIATATAATNTTTNDPTSATSDPSRMLPSNYNAASFKRTDPKAQTQAKRQAQFLEKLKAIKKARGEKDTVRTFVDRHTVDAAEKQREEMVKMRKEVDRLNMRVVRGDKKALERLQEIYSHMEEAESDEDDTLFAPVDGSTSDGHEQNTNASTSARPEGHGTNNRTDV